jgi:hypothetical protein
VRYIGFAFASLAVPLDNSYPSKTDGTSNRLATTFQLDSNSTSDPTGSTSTSARCSGADVAITNCEWEPRGGGKFLNESVLRVDGNRVPLVIGAPRYESGAALPGSTGRQAGLVVGLTGGYPASTRAS